MGQPNVNAIISNLYAAKQLITQLMVSVLTVIQNPTQANIDAAITAINLGTWAGAILPKLNYSLDGESYQWESYYAHLVDSLAKINALIQAESLPWVVTSRASASGGIGGPRGGGRAPTGTPGGTGWTGTVGG